MHWDTARCGALLLAVACRVICCSVCLLLPARVLRPYESSAARCVVRSLLGRSDNTTQHNATTEQRARKQTDTSRLIRDGKTDKRTLQPYTLSIVSAAGCWRTERTHSEFDLHVLERGRVARVVIDIAGSDCDCHRQADGQTVERTGVVQIKSLTSSSQLTRSFGLIDAVIDSSSSVVVGIISDWSAQRRPVHHGSHILHAAAAAVRSPVHNAGIHHYPSSNSTYRTLICCRIC